MQNGAVCPVWAREAKLKGCRNYTLVNLHQTSESHGHFGIGDASFLFTVWEIHRCGTVPFLPPPVTDMVASRLQCIALLC